MRRRLVLTFIGLAIVVGALYGVPRAFMVAHLVRGEEQHRINDAAHLVTRVLDERNGPVTTSLLDSINNSDEWIIVTRGASTVGTTGSEVKHNGDLTATRKLAEGGTVTVGRRAQAVSTAIRDAVLPLILLGLGLVALGSVAAYVLARRLAQPFQELADAARGLGQGDLHPDLPDYRIPELRSISQALASSGEQIEAMLTHERKLAVHASHELRTPIAALHLELEDLALWRETPPSVAGQLQHATNELDRLADAVDDLLILSRERREQDEIDVDLQQVIADAVARVEEPHRVTYRRGDAVRLRVERQTATQVIEELIVAALASGEDRVAVSATDRGSHVEVRVEPAEACEIPAPTAELARALGGHTTREGAALILRLPTHDDAKCTLVP